MSVKVRYRNTKKGYSVYLDIYKNYKRQYEYLDMFVTQDYSKVKRVKEEDKEKVELAKRICLKRELALKSGEHGFTPNHLKKTDFYQFFEEVSRKKNHNSYDCTLKKLKEHFGGDKLPVKELTDESLMGFIDYLSATLSENTANHYLKILNVTLNQAVKARVIPSNPLHFIDEDVKPKRQQPERVYLTIDELRKLNNTPFDGNIQIKQAYLFCCYTGLRIGDVVKMKWSEVNEDEWLLQFRQEKSKMKFHHLPLNETAIEILKSIPKHERNERVFWNFPASKSYGNMLIRIWAAKAGIHKHLTWHTGRHTHACLLLTNGVDIYTVSKLLGHSSVKITEIYGHLIDQKKNEAVNSIPSL